MKKKIYSLLLLLCLPLVASARVQIGFLVYNFSGTEAELISNNGTTKNLVIPASVTYEGTTYSVTSIGNSAFEFNSYVTSIVIPSSVTTIKDGAFRYCSKLTSVEIPNSVTNIGDEVFEGCDALASIVIPNSVESIGEMPFWGCENLTSIIVENGNQHYDSRENCNAIIKTSSNTLLAGCSNTVIPSSIISIGDNAFYQSSIKSIVIPSSVTSIGKLAFFGCTRLTSIDIPNSVKTIDYGAFFWCNKLTSVVIPNSVTSIGELAFYDCYNLKSLTISSSVTNIGQQAFGYCSNLEEVISYIPANKIFDVPSNLTSGWCTLYVPAGAADSYVAKGWGNYFNPIVEMENGNSYPLNVSAAEYATLYLTEAVEIPANVEVYTAGEVGNGYVYLNPVTDVIPAKTGVVVHAEAGTYDFAYYTGESVSPVLNNLFKGTATDELITPSKGKAAYVLSAPDGEVGFYRAQLTDGQFLNNANKVYLEVPELALNEGEIDSSEQLSLKFKFPETTGIEGATISAPLSDVYYNLNGMRIARPTQKGIYLKNGKKFIVK